MKSDQILMDITGSGKRVSSAVWSKTVQVTLKLKQVMIERLFSCCYHIIGPETDHSSVLTSKQWLIGTECHCREKWSSWAVFFYLCIMWLVRSELNNSLRLWVTLDSLHGNCGFIEGDCFLGLRPAERHKVNLIRDPLQSNFKTIWIPKSMK